MPPLLRAGATAAAAALASVVSAGSPTTVNLTLHPDYPALEGSAPLGIDGDAPSGFGPGCWRANVTGAPLYTSIILTPDLLFGRDDVRVEELKSVSYFTKKPGAEGTVDWFFQFYTKPYAGSPGAAWYGHRINSEPYFSEDLDAPAGQWNQWQSEASVDNRLRFYDSSNGYFGSYTDPFLQDLAGLTYPIPAWNLNASYPDLGPQEIMYFNLGLGTGWSAGFTGQIDGIRIELVDGSVATVNLENFPPPALALESDESCYQPGDTVTVAINLAGDAMTEIIGGQFFLAYDAARLAFVGAEPGSAVAGPGLFSMEIFEAHAPGALDYAVGVLPPNGGTIGDAAMALVTFTATAEICDAASLVSFRPAPAPFVTRLTDDVGGQVLPDLSDLPAISIDGTAPQLIGIPGDVTVNADAGSCSAVVTFGEHVQTFETDPRIGPTQAPGVWYTDRYPPHGFSSVLFDGDRRLQHSIDASDCSACRPPSYSTAFYDTQGRKYDTPGSTAMSIDVYVPADWATSGRRMAGLWGTARDGADVVSAYGIIEFTSDDATPRFRGWDNGVWIDMGLPTGFAYDAWYTLSVSIVGSDLVYTVGDVTITVPAMGSVRFSDTILQGHNTSTGVTYDIYWDNFAWSSMPFAVDGCDPAPALTYVRSDDAGLTLADSFPAGTTTITWTATDCSGNTAVATTDVTVESSNVLHVEIALQGVVDPGPFTRCVEFEIRDSGGAIVEVIPVELTFTGGMATGTTAIACSAAPYGSCVTARDPLHTLRSAGELAVVGTDYVASGFAPLRGGNLNDDGMIDILDFGVYAWQTTANPMPGADTTCGTLAPHADVNGDGIVDLADVTFISVNFFDLDEGCPAMLTATGLATRPRSSVSLRELRVMGLSHLAVADVNGDGRVDGADVSQFFMHAQP